MPVLLTSEETRHQENHNPTTKPSTVAAPGTKSLPSLLSKWTDCSCSARLLGLVPSCLTEGVPGITPRSPTMHPPPREITATSTQTHRHGEHLRNKTKFHKPLDSHSPPATARFLCYTPPPSPSEQTPQIHYLYWLPHFSPPFPQIESVLHPTTVLKPALFHRQIQRSAHSSHCIQCISSI